MKNKKNEPVINDAIKADINISVSDDDIKKRAYEIYQERGGLYAPPEADWLQAEAELRSSTYKKKREENL
jgi:FKBP-type peptidyl-prolyl cis-trans isomerase (trigger factor)